ncbi:uncharacterized protein TNCV_593301 [Trichonephila clavipes]|nr:uncharacterized protein TNCV_593301 [Trichonephila clavipes]
MGNFTDYNPGSHVIHGQEVNITCEPRYAVIHNATPVSCNNGTWTHVPVCAPARCRQLPDKPKNGLVIAPKTDHGMKALFLCRDGYQLAGPNVTECYYGEWTVPTPICKEIRSSLRRLSYRLISCKKPSRKTQGLLTEEAFNGNERMTRQQVNTQSTDTSFVSTLGTCYAVL